MTVVAIRAFVLLLQFRIAGDLARFRAQVHDNDNATRVKPRQAFATPTNSGAAGHNLNSRNNALFQQSWFLRNRRFLMPKYWLRGIGLLLIAQVIFFAALVPVSDIPAVCGASNRLMVDYAAHWLTAFGVLFFITVVVRNAFLSMHSFELVVRCHISYLSAFPSLYLCLI